MADAFSTHAGPGLAPVGEPASGLGHQAELNTFPFRFTNASHIRGGSEHAEQTSRLRRNDRIRVDEVGVEEVRADG